MKYETQFGTFKCKSCLFTFNKASPEHGHTGLCCQCQIACGELLIHASPEANKREQEMTRGVVRNSMVALPFLKR